MVTLQAHMPEPDVHNIPHQHAFVLVGNKTHFAVHMTQFHCELHKYQLIFKITLNGKDDALRKLQKKHPRDALFFCNGDNKATEWFSIPEIGSGRLTTLKGNIFLGLRRPPPEDKMPANFFPWSLDRVKPAIADVTVTVERVVLFRPYAHHERHPDHLTFFLWGEGDEAHVTNKQIGRRSSTVYEAASYGPDVDMVASLATAPDWLEETMLCAGTVVSTPAIRNYDDAGNRTVPPKPPFEEGKPVTMLYRGMTPGRSAVFGPTFMYCTAVINSGDRIPHTMEDVWGIYEMPKQYWRKAP